jgi:hypothetical protein
VLRKQSADGLCWYVAACAWADVTWLLRVSFLSFLSSHTRRLLSNATEAAPITKYFKKHVTNNPSKVKLAAITAAAPAPKSPSKVKPAATATDAPAAAPVPKSATAPAAAPPPKNPNKVKLAATATDAAPSAAPVPKSPSKVKFAATATDAAPSAAPAPKNPSKVKPAATATATDAAPAAALAPKNPSKVKPAATATATDAAPAAAPAPKNPSKVKFAATATDAAPAAAPPIPMAGTSSKKRKAGADPSDAPAATKKKKGGQPKYVDIKGPSFRGGKLVLSIPDNLDVSSDFMMKLLDLFTGTDTGCTIEYSPPAMKTMEKKVDEIVALLPRPVA